MSADVRVIAATNRDIDRCVADRTLREDFYYRLKVFPITIPPLRERREDILPLARALLGTYNRTLRKRVAGFDPEAERRLATYDWPGNVRELKNAIERALILATDDALLALDLLPPELREPCEEEPLADAPLGALAQTEARLIREALAACSGNQSRAALALGVSRGALGRRMRRLRIASDREES